MPILAKNPTASYSYDLLSRFEAGISLLGHEVKSIRTGHISLKGAFVTVHANQLFLVNAFIPPYRHAGPLPQYDPHRSRTLLIHRSEIRHLIGKIRTDGLTIVPLAVYTKGRYVKVECAIARGKKAHDKRATIAKREADRLIRRTLKTRG